MDGKRHKQISKFVSLVLRHQPDLIGIELDEHGWVAVEELIAKAQTNGHQFTAAELRDVVATNDKRRFAFSDDGRLIRANQGHTIPVDLDLVPVVPPEIVYHGTVAKCLPGIREDGILKGERHHVHLSPDRATATNVGARRGRPVILEIESGRMDAGGHIFYRSENGVWLTEHVPPEFVRFPDAG